MTPIDSDILRAQLRASAAMTALEGSGLTAAQADALAVVIEALTQLARRLCDLHMAAGDETRRLH